MASISAHLALVRHLRGQLDQGKATQSGLREPSRRPVRVDWTGGRQHDAHVKAHREVMSVLASWAPGDPMPWETEEDEVDAVAIDVVIHPIPRVLSADMMGLVEKSMFGDQTGAEVTRAQIIEIRRRWWLRCPARWRPAWVG